MMHWLYHIFFEPISFWEEVKVTLLIVPIFMLLYLVCWCLTAWMLNRAIRGKEK